MYDIRPTRAERLTIAYDAKHKGKEGGTRHNATEHQRKEKHIRTWAKGPRESASAAANEVAAVGAVVLRVLDIHLCKQP